MAAYLYARQTVCGHVKQLIVLQDPGNDGHLPPPNWNKTGGLPHASALALRGSQSLGQSMSSFALETTKDMLLGCLYHWQQTLRMHILSFVWWVGRLGPPLICRPCADIWSEIDKDKAVCSILGTHSRKEVTRAFWHVGAVRRDAVVRYTYDR